jgi:pyruvate-formate lyase-activating enzyme
MPPAPRSARSQLERDLSSVLLGGDPAGWLGYDPGPVGSDEVLAAWRRVTVGAQHPASGSGRGPTSRAIQVYAHFAFCKMSCRFCQYWHVLSRDDAELSAYTDHLVALLALYREALGRVRVANGYFGGGTPTALTAPMLRRFLAAFRATFEVSHELTTEAHPETLDAEKIAVLADGGINRVSMGLQSLDDAVLRRVGRTNGLAAALGEHVAHMQRRGILVNVDLMLGLPSQSAASFERDLVETMALGPDTITVYRYQPVHRLPAPPADELRYSRALWPLLPRCARRRYVPFGPLADARYSVLLVRGSARTARYVAENVVAGVEGLFGVERPRRYTDVDSAGVHLLGLGPGAVSHVLGFGWYRDVTAVRAASGTPRYWGTRLEPEAEARSQALLALAAGSWHALATPSGEHADGSHEPSAPALAPLRALLEAGVRAGALQRAFGWVRLRPGLSPDAREAFLRSLLPPRALERAHAVAALAFKLRKDVQPELVEIDRAHRELAGDDHG